MVTPRQIILMLLVAAGSPACSATGKVDCEGHFTYNPDSFTAEQKEWIEESSNRWNEWVGHKVTWVRPGYSDLCSIDTGATAKEEAIGEIQFPLNKILVDVDDLKKLNRLNSYYFEGIVMHELGHALGYGHTPKGSNSLMAPAGTQDFTELDRIECIKHGMCLTLLAGNQAE